jgi:hypothetical protein
MIYIILIYTYINCGKERVVLKDSFQSQLVKIAFETSLGRSKNRLRLLFAVSSEIETVSAAVSKSFAPKLQDCKQHALTYFVGI